MQLEKQHSYDEDFSVTEAKSPIAKQNSKNKKSRAINALQESTPMKMGKLRAGNQGLYVKAEFSAESLKTEGSGSGTQIITQYTDSATNQTHQVQKYNNGYKMIVVPSSKVKVKPVKNSRCPTTVVATPLRQKMHGSGSKSPKKVSRDSTPDELDLVEVEKQKLKVRYSIADESEDYSDTCRESISDINQLYRQSISGRERPSFQEFSREFFSRDPKEASQKQKENLKYEHNAMLFRESTNKAMLKSLLGRETDFENPYREKNPLVTQSQVAQLRERKVENYLDEDFMETLIEKIKKKDKQFGIRGTDDLTPQKLQQPMRLCVDYKYLQEQLQQETVAELRTAKQKAAAAAKRHSSNGTAVMAQRNAARRDLGEQDAPMIKNDPEELSLRSTVKFGAERSAQKEGLVVVKKINKTIDIKEKEHDDMRNQFLRLIQGESTPTPAGLGIQMTPEKPKERGNQEVSILSLHEWNTLVGIYRTNDNFDPLQVVDRERIRKSLLNGIPLNLRGDIWCMLCRCNREKSMHGEGMYKKLADPSIANKNDEHRIRKDVGRTFTNYPTTLKYLQCEGKDFNWKSEEGQKMLYNVLLAYANYDSQIGYVQGMNYIAGMLLMHIQDEEQVFWCILYIMNRKNWRCIYKADMAKLMELLSTVEQKLKREYVDLYNHLEENDFSVGAAFSPLFITLYIYQMEHCAAMRIMEFFILDGEQALLKVLYKMIEMKGEKIQTLEEIELIMYLRTNMINECIAETGGIEALLDYGGVELNQE